MARLAVGSEAAIRERARGHQLSVELGGGDPICSERARDIDSPRPDGKMRRTAARARLDEPLGTAGCRARIRRGQARASLVHLRELPLVSGLGLGKRYGRCGERGSVAEGGCAMARKRLNAQREESNAEDTTEPGAAPSDRPSLIPRTGRSSPDAVHTSGAVRSSR